MGFAVKNMPVDAPVAFCYTTPDELQAFCVLGDPVRRDGLCG
jgi:hypothetical protein